MRRTRKNRGGRSPKTRSPKTRSPKRQSPKKLSPRRASSLKNLLAKYPAFASQMGLNVYAKKFSTKKR